MNNEITYYYLREITIECVICDNNIKVKDSYQVVADNQKLEIIDDLLRTFKWFNDYRTRDNMLREWKVHNLFYKLKIKRSSTKDTDIEYKQSMFMRLSYWFLSKFAKNV